MKPLIRGALLALAVLFAAPAAARTIVNVEPYNGYVCVITYDNGDREIDYCPLDWPPASQPLTVGCTCEHVGSPYSDLCEATPQGEGYRYAWHPRGQARIPIPPNPTGGAAFYSCPNGVPPGSPNCGLSVTVTAPTGSAECHGF